MDFYREACRRLDPLVILLREGTFHQFHGGVATNVPWKDHPGSNFSREYELIRGRAFAWPNKAAIFLGNLPPQALGFLEFSAAKAFALHEKK